MREANNRGHALNCPLNSKNSSDGHFSVSELWLSFAICILSHHFPREKVDHEGLQTVIVLNLQWPESSVQLSFSLTGEAIVLG